MSKNSEKRSKEKSSKKIFSNLLVRENNKEISSLILSSKIHSIHPRMNHKSNDFNQSNSLFKKDEYILKETFTPHEDEFFVYFFNLQFANS